MLNMFELLLPLMIIVLISIPLVNVFRGKVSAKSAKTRMITHICLFFTLLLGVIVFQVNGATAQAAGEVVDQMAGSNAQGMGFIAAALATGLSAVGGGIAVAAAAPAAIGAVSENEKNFGKAMIFVVLGEGIAIYGLIISILIIMLKL